MTHEDVFADRPIEGDTRVLEQRHVVYDDVPVLIEKWGAALEKAKSIVDRSLLHLFEPGKSAEELMASYVMFGEDPSIRPSPEGVAPFSARDYARQRAPEVVSREGKP